MPQSAHAETFNGFYNPSTSIQPLALPMPYKKTFTYNKTVYSATTAGFAYIYLKADATIDAQNDRVISLNGAWSYQSDAARSFVRWEQLSLKSGKTSNSIWVKATGYAHFRGSTIAGFSDKVYVELEHTWKV